MKLAVCLVVLAACQIDDDLVRCGDYLCPAGTLCDTVHDSCATAEQLTACANKDDHADCTANGIDGGCFSGVCLRRGCGNGIIESGMEACDDGNERSLDGCSSDCRSDETCGNSVVDPGEECDDGGFLSKDGCDSRCFSETGVWREVPLGFEMDVYVVADDEARQRLVAPGLSSTWELVGDSWQVAPGTLGSMRAPYFDTVRGQIVAMVAEPLDDAYRAKAWNGSSWAPISDTIANPLIATFDRQRGQPLVFADTLMTFDANGAWTEYPTQPTGGIPYILAYDPANDEIVSLAAFTAAEEYFDPDSSGTDTWTQRTRPFAGGHAYGLDGTTLVVVAATKLYRRGASGWTTDPAEDLPSQIPGTRTGLVYRRGGALIVERGVSRCRRTGTTWSCTSNPSNTGYDLVQDGDNHMRVVGGPYSWLVDETLGPRITLPSSPAGFHAHHAVYHRERRTIVATGTTPPCGSCPTETRELTADGWTLRHSGDAFLGPLLYDPDGFTVVQQRSTGADSYSFLETATWTWNPLGLPDGGQFEYLVYDTQLHHFVGLQIVPFTTFVYDLARDRIDRVWEQDEVAPRGDLAADERAGSIVAFPPQNQLTRLWERRAGIWTPRMPLPYGIDFVSSAYESDSGRLWVMGWASPRVVAFVHEYQSATPSETCVDDATDADGDGRSGCSDPDCYWNDRCSSCLPFANCPGL